MGLLDGLQTAGEAVGKYFKDRFGSVGNAYKTAWTEDVPGNWKKLWGGIFTMTMSPQFLGDDGRDSWSKGLGLWLDGMVGLGSGTLKGTVGGAFEAPALHEATWLVDKAYRYGVAYPLAYQNVSLAAARLEANDAKLNGGDYVTAYMNALWRRQPFGGKGIWSADVRKVTPGQALIWNYGGGLGMLHPGNSNDPMSWLRSHDPRTEVGQAAFNSPDSEFLLKYGSGTADFFLAIGGDPTMAVAAVAKAGRLRYVNAATEKRLRDPQFLEREVSSAHYQAVLKAAKDEIATGEPNPIRFQQRVMPRAKFGSHAATALLAAAKVSDDLFRDAYVVSRGFDGLYMPRPDLAEARKRQKPTSALVDSAIPQVSEPAQIEMWGAQQRIMESSPEAATLFARQFAAWNIGEDAAAFGVEEGASKALASLAEAEKKVFLETLTERLPGQLALEGQPRLSRLNEIRMGVHSWAEGVRPIKVGQFQVAPPAGRRLGRFVRAFMPNEGFAQFLDVEDYTSISSQYFRANLVRSGMNSGKVEQWVARWAATRIPEARQLIHLQAQSDAIKEVAERHGLDHDTVVAGLGELLARQSAVRQIMEGNEQYISERAARVGGAVAAEALERSPKFVKDAAGKLTPAEKRGEYGKTATAMPDVDGVTTAMFQDLRVMPGLAPKAGRAVLTSQTRRQLPMIDYQALDGQLSWWKWQQGPGRLALDASFGDVVKHAGAWTLAKAAKTKVAWDRLINAADFANMLWKASALLRPAQTPRNLADDVMRRMMLFGQLPLVMSMMKGSKRAVQNWGPSKRGGLIHDTFKEKLTGRRVDGSNVFTVEVKDPIDHAPHNSVLAENIRKATSLNLKGEFDEANAVTRREDMPRDFGWAWWQGMINWDDIIKAIQGWAAHPYMHEKLGDVHDLYESFMRGDLGYEDVSGPLIDQSRLLAQINEDRIAKGRPPLPEVPPELRKSTKVPAFYKSMQQEKIKQLGPVKQLRLFKMILLQHYMAREGLAPAFRQDLPRLAAGEEALAAELRGEPAPKAAPTTRSAEKLETAEDLDERGAQNTYLAQWVDTVFSRHKAAREAVAGGPDRQPGWLAVNPLDGLEPESLGPDAFETVHMESLRRPINNDGAVSKSAITQLEAFIVDNLDNILRPDHILSLEFDPVGNIWMGVSRARPEILANNAIKASAAFQLKNFPIKDIIDAGHEGVVVKLPDGKELELRAALGGSAEAEVFMKRISAQSGIGTHNYLLDGYSPLRMLDEEGGYGRVVPGQKGYAQSWERAANAQIAGDWVMQQLLSGRPVDEVIKMAYRTREGRQWIQRIHFLGVNWVSHIRTLRGMLDEYVPLEDSDAGRALRQKVLERVATYDDLKAVRPDPATQPEVHGASIDYNLGKGAVFRGIAHAADRAQKYISDLPTDKASRFPFFSEAYRRHLTDLVQIAYRHTMRQRKSFEARKKTIGDNFNNDQVNAADVAEGVSDVHYETPLFDPRTGVIPMKTLRRLEEQARERAYHDTKYYLYDVTLMNDVARLTRMIVPFSSAIMDSYIKYSRIARDTGGAAVLRGMYYWEMFERNEVVQDENGYVLRKGPTGQDEWYKVDPETGETTRVPDDQVGKQRYVQFRLPSELGRMAGKKYFGVDTAPVFAVNQDNFNVFIDLPNSGPMVAIPANEFALDNPEFGESATIRQFVLPFGPSVDRAKVALPSTIRTAWEAFQGEDGPRAEAQAKAIFQAELISYSRGERKNPPTIQEARERSAMMRGLRFSASWITPVSYQVKSPYQPYIDTYRQFVREDPKSADERFLTQYGDEFYAVAMATTRNNAGMTATIESQKNFQKYKDWVAAYPDLAGLITGGEGGEFSKSVYEAQKATPIRPGSKTMVREVMSLDESVTELEKRRVWQQYQQLMDHIDAAMVDRGLTSLRSDQAKDLAAVRDRFVEANRQWIDPASGKRVPSPWYQDYSTNNSAAAQNRIDAMWEIVKDPDMQKRDDIRGLVEYLDARRRMQNKMAKSGFRSLSSAGAAQLRSQWEKTSFGIRERNVMFAPVWSRYLSNDDDLTLPKEVVKSA